MSLRSVFAIAVLLLSGCHSDYARLEFDQFVTADIYNNKKINPIYSNQIKALVADLGLSSSAVKVRVDKKDSKAIILSMSVFSRLSDEQKSAIYTALNEIVMEKNADPSKIALHIKLLGEQVESEDPLVWNDVDYLPDEVTADLKINDIMVAASSSFADLIAHAAGVGTTSAGLCTVGVELSRRIPFHRMSLDGGEAGFSNVTLSRRSSANYRYYEMPAELRVSSPAFQHLLDSQQMEISTHVSLSDLRIRIRKNGYGLQFFEFNLGQIGEVYHQNFKTNIHSKFRLESQCRQKAADLGRPFSFLFGDSIDRLNNIELL
ncbi:hypothetical protein [Thaumasiovibrio subtropicus]|uniref:hypothetical protein n=1 Tax=Thaumasiovibrio subtropicus TaxID=1891207 RepID=UPI000B355A74|nr:hypothetical protein [Thaumasiovibrio subtropicus]